MKDVATTRCDTAGTNCPVTTVSSLAALSLQVLSPLEQTHILGGSNLTVDQKAQQEGIQMNVETCNCLEV